MLAEPNWVPFEVIVKANFVHTQLTGERRNLLQPEKLDSAMHRARQAWQYDPSQDTLDLAIKYIEGVATAHAFEQGNKRSAFDAAFYFLKTNGWDVSNQFATIGGFIILFFVEGRISADALRDSLAMVLMPSDGQIMRLADLQYNLHKKLFQTPLDPEEADYLHRALGIIRDNTDEDFRPELGIDVPLNINNAKDLTDGELFAELERLFEQESDEGPSSIDPRN